MNRRKVLFFALLPLPLLAMQVGAMMASPKQPPLPEVTPQDAILAVEALEARQNAKNEAIWETIRLYHPDNDEWYEAWKSSDDVRQLPGVSR